LFRIVGIVILAIASMAASDSPSLPGASIQVGGAAIDVSFESGELNLPRALVIRWISKSACAVSEYYAHFPVEHLRVDVVPIEGGRAVGPGRTFIPDQMPVIRVMVGRFATESDLKDDWVMTHEMVHLAFPSVPHQHHWIEEGIATYVEPIARVQVSDLRAEKVWRDMLEGMPHGEPGPDDQGLDNTHTWGRTYWGGALFCLVADVEIHRRTNNQHGLQDALRGILKAGNMLQDWPLERALKAGDDTVGVPVLTELYSKMKDAPVDPNLPKLWHDLGIKVAGDSVSIDSAAPMASIARSIMARRSDATCDASH
jgi:hypothetical protein